MASVKKAKVKEESAFDKLSDKHKEFVSHYCGDCLYNATRSYLATYKTVTYESAMTKGCELLRNIKVKAAVKEISSKQFADIQSDIEKNETYKKIKALSSMSIEEVVDLAGRTLVVKSLDEIPQHARYAIRSIKYDRKESDSGINENTHVTFEDKLKALETLAKIQGLMDKDENRQTVEIIVKGAERPQ